MTGDAETGTMTAHPSEIPGLLTLDLTVHRDDRGWFKENWHRAAMVAAGLPDFGPVQHNLAFNARRGVTRGFHAEPWDKLVSVATGRVMGAWVDLRDGPGFGRMLHRELGPETAVFVPRGVANAYQVLADATSYSYLVNGHWRADVAYVAVHPGDPSLAVPWAIPLAEADLSEKDRAAPLLAEVAPLASGPRVLILGADGQLGRALRLAFPAARALSRHELDVADAAAVAAWPWADHDVVLNAAAYTGVDAAETPEGRRAAWAVNAEGPALIAAAAVAHRMTMVHYSTDYVFDGGGSGPDGFVEDDPVAPLGGYGQSKAAGEFAVRAVPHHYLLRTSGVVGEGRNFVRTMAELAAAGGCPQVVDDQIGRLTFADELARATRHLLEVDAAPGTYHVTGGGPERSWYDVARRVFELSGRDPADVTPVSTEDYRVGRDPAPRPARSALDLSRLRATGFEERDADELLAGYVSTLIAASSDSGRQA